MANNVWNSQVILPSDEMLQNSGHTSVPSIGQLLVWICYLLSQNIQKLLFYIWGISLDKQKFENCCLKNLQNLIRSNTNK